MHKYYVYIYMAAVFKNVKNVAITVPQNLSWGLQSAWFVLSSPNTVLIFYIDNV